MLELAPLRWCDAEEVQWSDVNSTEYVFLSLHLLNVIPSSAINSLTLYLLLGLFNKYEVRRRSAVAGIQLRGSFSQVAREQNPSPTPYPTSGCDTPLLKRLRVASCIAGAMYMFADRVRRGYGPEGDGVPDEDVPLSA